MPLRQFTAGSNYRYGFNGKEEDDEVKGNGNQQDYGMRIYDSRLGKFLSVDPLSREYPWNSTYAFAENDVIRNIDLDGAEKLNYMSQYQYSGSWTDYVKWIPNAAGNLYNGVIVDTWNSGVNTVQNLRNGTYIQSLGNDLDAIKTYLKQTGINTWNYTSRTPIGTQFLNAGKTIINPQTWETGLTIVMGSKMPLPSSLSKGNLLKPPINTVPPFKGLGSLRNPAVTPGLGETALLDYSSGLASRKFSKFSNVVQGGPGEGATKYLWTIDNRGINIALEQTPATTNRGFITHTNISQSAYAGGEVWFTGEKSVFINPKSARFGGGSMTTEQWNSAKAAWEKIGYKVEASDFNPPKPAN